MFSIAKVAYLENAKEEPKYLPLLHGHHVGRKKVKEY